MPLSVLLNDELGQNLVFNLRLPRLITSALLGMSLAAAGGVMQMLSATHWSSPVSRRDTGSRFWRGNQHPFLLHLTIVVELSATAFAILGLVLSYFIARRIRFGGWVLRLVLSGIAVSAIFSAGLGILKYLADPTSQLPEIVFWLLGGLWSVTWKDLLYILPVVVVGLLIIT